MKHIASVSFGKDSLAMLLMLIDKGCPLDEVVFYDTGMEFEAIYNIRNEIVKLLNEKGIKYTELHPKNTFEYNMFERPVNKRDGSKSKGYSWCGGRCRWGTTEKVKTIEKYCKDSVQYIGIAYDELKRIKENSNKRYPLYEWGVTEQEALNYCYQKGFNWLENGIELYEYLDRVSCWCCANKNLKELRNYKRYLPNYWEKLKELQRRTNRPFKNNKYTINDLEIKFEKEERK